METEVCTEASALAPDESEKFNGAGEVERIDPLSPDAGGAAESNSRCSSVSMAARHARETAPRRLAMGERDSSRVRRLIRELAKDMVFSHFFQMRALKQ